jgi:hypothetical protein
MPGSWSAFYKRFDGKVEIHCFGKQAGDLNENEISTIARQLEVNIVLCPETYTFNAEVCEPTELSQRKKIGGIKICRGCLADGVVIPLGQAACLRTADCPTIVARHDFTGEVIAAHAGRDSLIINQGRWRENGGHKRSHESVVEKIFERLTMVERRISDIEVFSCGGVGAINFRHPSNDERQGVNNHLRSHYIAMRYGNDCLLGDDLSRLETGALDLHRLIRNQCLKLRIPDDNIHCDQVDTARDRAEWFSRRGGDPVGHNTILVIRRT